MLHCAKCGKPRWDHRARHAFQFKPGAFEHELAAKMVILRLVEDYLAKPVPPDGEGWSVASALMDLRDEMASEIARLVRAGAPGKVSPLPSGGGGSYSSSPSGPSPREAKGNTSESK